MRYKELYDNVLKTACTVDSECEII